METHRAEQLLSDKPALRLAVIDVNALSRMWDDVLPLLEEACAHSGGEMTPALVATGMGAFDGIERYRMLAMVDDSETPRAVMIVQIVETGTGGRRLECVIVSGADVSSWMPFEPKMDEWARSFGCTKVRIPMGRKGWIKRLSHWRLAGYVLERDI